LIHESRSVHKARSLLVALALAIASAFGAASAASASGTYGPKVFSVGDQYFEASDSNGDFSAQVTYLSNGTVQNPVAFGFTLSVYLQSIATSTMTCKAWQFKNGASTGASDNHTGLPVSYQWHWSFPVNPIGANMQVSGNCNFSVNVGGNPGQANVGLLFNYVVGDGSASIRQHSTASLATPYKTTLTITYTEPSK